MATINANNKKCKEDRIQRVEDVYLRILELIEDFHVSHFIVESVTNVMLFIDNQMLFNNELDSEYGVVDAHVLLEEIKKYPLDSYIQSFNHSWSINAYCDNRKFVVLESSKAKRFTMPMISFNSYKEHVKNIGKVADCSYSRLCDKLGINDHKSVAPILDFDSSSVRKWREDDAVPLAVAVRASVICHSNMVFQNTTAH